MSRLRKYPVELIERGFPWRSRVAVQDLDVVEDLCA